MKAKPASIDPKQQIKRIIRDNRQYFWDKGPLDPTRDKYIMIERILELGTEDDVETILNYYGIAPIKEVLKQSRELSPKTVNYFALLFGLPRGETRCFLDVSQRIWQPY